MLFAARRHGRAGHAADDRTDRRALTAAGDAADDGPEPGAAADFPGGALALALAGGLDVRGRDFVDDPAERDVFSLSVILSLPFIWPDCWTLTACSVADAPRGMTIDPPTITGSSTIPLNR